ncbi:cadherin-2-like [Astyanax mexicanus]|uniref:Cadherin-2-like n=1 Tax=Astyanax mexicanus TaxID=7994 RepID=A0A8T2LT51_ASTMX|nr:cadherin-2-like [Astyanax mexicanus]
MKKLLVISLGLILSAVTIILADPDGGGGEQTLRRQKREWIIPPRKLMENVDYTNLKYIAKIRSDEETRTTILYSLKGKGADEEPVGLFQVDRLQGLVTIHGILDRETTSSYHLLGVAKFQNGSYAEKDIDLRIEVQDQNDCSPVFNIQAVGSVYELSETGTYIINITATDADKPNTPHSQIAYSIVEQSPAGNLFYIDRGSGKIFVSRSSLDREVQESYTLKIIGSDMNGQPGGNTGTGTVSINVLDVNDNVPTLEKNSYEGSVEENTKSVEVIRIRSFDRDQIHTDNWRAVYTIVSGNEAGYFTITTDNETNEGIIILNKEVDYEEMKEINLQVTVSNKAAYHSSVVIKQPQTYPIKIKVINVPEGPRFQPSVKVISLSEDKTIIDLKKVIATYTAIDSDTLTAATNVRYVKGEDADNWLIIDEKTANIRLNKVPDRESTFLINGTYYAKILCITNDYPIKTATGTIAIQVEDFNDHCPILTSSAQTMCLGDSVVYVTATDVDEFPNAEPFLFRLFFQSKKGKWTVERLNETTAILRSQEMLWPGHYTVGLEVEDQQGKVCGEQFVHVTVCTCNDDKVCLPKRRGSEVVFGAAGVLVMLLGLLLLLLIPLLLLFCVCGGAAAAAGFKAFPTEQTQHLITYHTEGQGEDKDIPLLQVPTELDAGIKTGHVEGLGEKGHWGAGGWGGGREDGMMNTREDWHFNEHFNDFNGNYNSMFVTGGHAGRGGMGAFEGIALSEAFLGDYYSKKSNFMAEHQAAGESLLVFDFEGEGGNAGPLDDICAELHDGDDLAFLNDLGPQFRALAELCRGSAIDIEVSSVKKPPAPEPAPARVHLNVREEGSKGGLRTEVGSSSSTSASASASVSASASSSSTHMTSMDYRQSGTASTAVSTAGVLTHTVPSQTLLIQQPAVYYTSTPVYVVDPKPQATLLVASGPVLGMQENVVLVDQRGGSLVQGASTLGKLNQTQTKVLLEKKPVRGAAIVEGSGPQVLLGHSEVGSGSVRIVESGRVQTMEPVRTVQSSLHSSIREGQSIQLGQGLTGSHKSLAVAQHEQPLLTVPHAHGGTHQKVREERISVIEKSFQSSAAV